ncbi:MAG TPA: amino-acid racemase [Clostridia bacterium]|nr:amino-acid racemase [Clostridia bacterium]
MQKSELQTPAILVDLDILAGNIKRYQALCNKNGKQLWPMVKTHKSTEIAALQQDAGATGFLCGTLDECEGLCRAGMTHIMYAYPVAGSANIKRAIELAKKCNFIIRIDSLDGARRINEAAQKAGIQINYTIIIDSGLHRLGIPPEHAADFAKALKDLTNLAFKGISTHPGHVYAASGEWDLAKYIQDEKAAVAKAVAKLKEAGFSPEIVSSGSTPTFAGAVEDPNINILHPGNYVFHDYIQMSLGVARETDCALSVLTTVISYPAAERYICDAGAKCLGLDKGAHGNTAVQGYGYIKGHPELALISLSEEVGKIRSAGPTGIKVGDQLEIIPNHACSAANLTGYLIGCRGERVERVIQVDLRGNSTPKNVPEFLGHQ